MTQTTQNFICCDFSIIILNFNTTMYTRTGMVADTIVTYTCHIGNNCNQRGRYSHVVVFWGLLPNLPKYSKLLYRGVEEGLLAHSPSFLPF